MAKLATFSPVDGILAGSPGGIGSFLKLTGFVGDHKARAACYAKLDAKHCASAEDLPACRCGHRTLYLMCGAPDPKC